MRRNPIATPRHCLRKRPQRQHQLGPRQSLTRSIFRIASHEAHAAFVQVVVNFAQTANLGDQAHIVVAVRKANRHEFLGLQQRRCLDHLPAGVRGDILRDDERNS